MELRVIGVDRIEYKEVKLSWHGVQFIERLNELGKDGWEVVDREGDRWLFKRVIREIR